MQPLNNVPRFTLNNTYKATHPTGPNSFCKWRKLCPSVGDINNDIENTQLPWMSLYKTHKDLLKIDLVTTIGYVQDNATQKKQAHFIKGFPLMLQGPNTQFNNSTNITSEHWENDWTFYKQHVEDFSGNLIGGYGNSNWFDQDNSHVITDFDNDDRRNLLILDLSTDFYLHNDIVSGQNFHINSDTNLPKMHKRTRPSFLVIRIDDAIEESTFRGNTEHGLVVDASSNFWHPTLRPNKNKLYVFNYVYSGYVISPYDFMANFTTDYLRSNTISNGVTNHYLINRDIHYGSLPISPDLISKRPIQPTIQLIKNNGSFDPITNNVSNLKSAKAHNKIISPFRYNFHLYPTILEISGLKYDNTQQLTDAIDTSDPMISTPLDITDIPSRMNTIKFKINENLYPRAPNPSTENWNWYIENLLWCSLSSARHTLYMAGEDNGVVLNVGNYLNVNELTYTQDFDGQNNNDVLTPTEQNPDYMPTPLKASGSIIRGRDMEDTDTDGNPIITGLNEIHIARKTLTPYYIVDKTDTDYNYKNYAFNWSDTTKNWSQLGINGIDESVDKIDVSNYVAVEFRNLIRFKTFVEIKYHFKNEWLGNIGVWNNPRTTFITNSQEPSSDNWKNTGSLSNNDAFPLHPVYQTAYEQYNFIPQSPAPGIFSNTMDLVDPTNGGVTQPEQPYFGWTTWQGDAIQNRKLSTLNKYGEYFSFNWNYNPFLFNNTTNGGTQDFEGANSRKYGYLIDVASGRHEMKIEDITISANNYLFNQGFYKSPQNYPNENYQDNFLLDISKNVVQRKKLIIKSNVHQFRVNTIKTNTNTNGDYINANGNSVINFSLDATGKRLALHRVPDKSISNEAIPIFGYLNFTGIRNSEFLGNTAGSYDAIKTIFTKYNNNDKNVKTRTPYFEIKPGQSGFQSNFKNSLNMYYNPHLFYSRSNFGYSNVYITTSNQAGTYNGNEVLFYNESGSNNIDWRLQDYNSGLDITNLSFETIGADKGIKFYLYPTDATLFIPTLVGKISRNDRAYVDDIEIPCIELNNNISLNIPGYTNPINFNCFHFDNINFCSSQCNNFIPDFWKWSEKLTNSPIPDNYYSGPPAVLLDRNVNNRYNVYNNEIIPLDSGDIQVDNSIYLSGVHNPQYAFENQTLINFIIEVSKISTNFSHILVNTWNGAKNEKYKFQSVGLKSEPSANGEYAIVNNPIMTIKILGGNEVTPPISDKPLLLEVFTNAKFNYATDDNATDEDGNSKAPSAIAEVGETIPVDFTYVPFTTHMAGKGWFAVTGYDISRNGIFKDKNHDARVRYETLDFSANEIEKPPTSMILTDSSQNSISGRFSKLEQEFPFELLFCYPFSPDMLFKTVGLAKPNGFYTIYSNSDGTSETKSFEDYKGFKRFSSLYAISLIGSGRSDNNLNFIGRQIFPDTVVINCVELPPPIQVNNSNDMLAGDSKSVKIVWKGYNFSKPQGDFRDKYGNSGNIQWTITRLQTQLGITTTLLNAVIEPDNKENGNGDNYNLSTYSFTDNNVRIYDKYIYTISGTFVYTFKRVSIDINSTRLELPFGSFNTPEIIICKNNQFEYGRYNTTTTNLKLFRPLLMNREGGQQDKYGNQSAGGQCIGNIFSGTNRISSSQNIYANTSNQLTKKQTYVLLAKQANRPFR